MLKHKNYDQSKDKLSTKERSRNMANVRQMDTKPEIFLRKLLHKEGFRFRKNVKSLLGSPDIVLPRYGVVIFVHGCFWHRHSCKKGQSIPSSRQEFWKNKFNKNVARDKLVREGLTTAGWRVVVVWECEIKKPEKVISYLKGILK